MRLPANAALATLAVSALSTAAAALLLLQPIAASWSPGEARPQPRAASAAIDEKFEFEPALVIGTVDAAAKGREFTFQPVEVVARPHAAHARHLRDS